MNCCTPESITKCFDNINDKSLNILKKYDCYLGAYPNGFNPIPEKWTLDSSHFITLRSDITPKALYDKFYKKWIEKYYEKKRLRLLGGCCRITPPAIKYMVDNIKKEFPKLIANTMMRSKL